MWCGRDGVEVEAISLDGMPVLRAVRVPDERIILYGFCRSPLDLARLGIDLAEVEEVPAEQAGRVLIPRRRPRSPPPDSFRE